jgi:putative membrane-bound dehydrogenase-like protein
MCWCGWTAFLSAQTKDPPDAVRVPEVWKAPPPSASGWRWYRCRVRIPAEWKERAGELFLEAVDDARSVRIDGREIAQLGAFPPAYRSGLGETKRFPIPAERWQSKHEIVLEIRTYSPASRMGFNVAAPALFAKDEALSLAGTWQFIAAETLPEKLAEPPLLETAVVFASEMNAQLKKLPGDEGPLTPEQSLAKLKTPDDLTVELVLAEPDIAQPLSLKFDTRGRMWVVEYRQYPEPAGLKMISRDKFLRSVYDQVPAPPPRHFRGQDRVSIHTDIDGDGRFNGPQDRHQVFVEGLSLASSVAIDRDGVWVLNPPYLLFYPDANHDDIPDGDPEVHLEGVGIEDSHSVANSLRFGSDGWLYAGQGSTVTGNIRRPGEKEAVHSLGQLIWRYHPQRKKYEVFAEGGGNTFGVEIDAAGRIFSGHNGGNTRGFHYVQGGYYAKGFGKHGELSNPYAFGYFPAMTHHDVPRFTHTFIFCDADQLPPNYRGRMFAVAPLQGQVMMSERDAEGSTFKTKDVGLAIETGDSWFRPVDVQLGPDGGVYVADMYEQRIDHASHYQGRIHRESGRVVRLRAKDQPLPRTPDVHSLTADQLLASLQHPNRAVRQLAVDEIRQRQSREMISALRELMQKDVTPGSLEALWGLHALGALDDDTTAAAIEHKNDAIARWGVRLACDDGECATPRAQAALQDAAFRSRGAEFLSQLAASARRLPAEQGLRIVRDMLLAARSDALRKDPHLPLLLWWAIEQNAATQAAAIRTLILGEEKLWTSPSLFLDHISERLVRRYAATGKRADLVECAAVLKVIAQHGEKSVMQSAMRGFEQGMGSRKIENLPPELVAALAAYDNASPTLALRQGKPEAVAEALQMIADEKADASRREQYVAILGGLKQPTCVPVLLEVIRRTSNDGLRFAALSAVQNYADDAIGETLVAFVGKWPVEIREVAVAVLASRRAWAERLVTAVEKRELTQEIVSTAAAQRLTLLGDVAWGERIGKHWPAPAALDAAAVRVEIEQKLATLHVGSGNPYQGKKLYADSCGKCHLLFGQGGKIGPDLTAFQRTDVRRLLLNVIQPSAEIREGFETYQVQTTDGRSLSGFIADQDPQTVTLRTAEGQSLVVVRGEIEQMKALPVSVMPVGLLQKMSDQQLRDLFAYLRATQPLAE